MLLFFLDFKSGIIQKRNVYLISKKQVQVEELNEGSEVLHDLNARHDEMSGDLLHLLGLNLAQTFNQVEKDLDMISNSLMSNLDAYEIEDVQSFLNMRKLPDNMTLEDYELIQKNHDLVLWRLRKELARIDTKNIIFQNLDEFKEGLVLFGYEFEHLCIGWQKLTRFKPSTLSFMFQFLPESLKTLDLNTNELGNIDLITLFKVFGHLPKGLKTLNISSNELQNLKAKPLAEALRYLPQGLDTIDIGNTKFQKYTHDEMIEIISALPEGLKELKLNNTYLRELDSKYYMLIGRSLPKGLRSLSLSDNLLGVCGYKVMLDMFYSLPDSLEYLDLSSNEFSRFDEDQFQFLMKALPKGLRKLGMFGNNLEFKLEDIIWPKGLDVEGMDSGTE